MALYTPEIDIATYLDAQTALTLGTDLFIGPRRAADTFISNTSAFVLETGGDPPDGYLGTDVKWIENVSLNVQVRATKNDYQTGKALANTIWEALNFATITAAKDSIAYMDVFCDQARPIYLGTTNNDEHLWSVNVTAMNKQGK